MGYGSYHTWPGVRSCGKIVGYGSYHATKVIKVIVFTMPHELSKLKVMVLTLP